MVLHAPSLHFHIGAWFVTAVCTMLAFWMNLIQKRGLFDFKKWFGDNFINQLDFTAHVCGLIGFAGILGSAYLGLVDASGVEFHASFESYQEALDTIMVLLDINVILQGLDSALDHQLLGFKVVWTIVGIQLFAISGIIRFYFVTIRKIKIFDTHIAVQTIYSGASSWGFVVMVAISATGGIYSYNESIMQNIPILSNLIPGSNFSLLPILSIFFGFLALMILLSAIVWKKEEKKEKKEELNESL